MPRSILIFGGAFDPPTLAHEAIIAACLKLRQFDEVWLMPSGDRLDKQMGSRDADRLAMLAAVHRSSFGGDHRLLISDFELSLPRPTSTYLTVRALKKAYPDATFCFVFGRDSYSSMPSWPHGQTLQRQLPMVVFTSGPGPTVAAPNVTVRTIPTRYDMTSSTKVRKALRAGDRYTKLPVSSAVLGYLAQHDLYHNLY